MAMLVGVILAVNSAKRIHSFSQTFQKVQEAENRLEKLRKENEALKNELKYKESNEFAEKEIRDKLGLAKERETIVLNPQESNGQSQESNGQDARPNWQKWRDLFLPLETSGVDLQRLNLIKFPNDAG